MFDLFVGLICDVLLPVGLTPQTPTKSRQSFNQENHGSDLNSRSDLAHPKGPTSGSQKNHANPLIKKIMVRI